MTETARDRLVAGLRRRRRQGDRDPPRRDDTPVDRCDGRDRRRRAEHRPRLLTWGLLGPGKGIEWAIDAMRQLADLVPRRSTWWPARRIPRCASSAARRTARCSSNAPSGTRRGAES